MNEKKFIKITFILSHGFEELILERTNNNSSFNLTA